MNIHTGYPQNNRVNFTAMKKSQFSGIDFSVVEKFRAPIEKFNTMEDFQNWAGGKYKELVSRDFGGRDDVVVNQRHNMGKEWNYMLMADGESYTPSERLLIFNGITKDLKPDDNTYMPSFNKIVLSKTMKNLGLDLDADRKHQFDFGKIYRANLKEYYAKDIDSDFTGWAIIPSRSNDRVNFNDNVRKLQSISNTHWCTKSTHAKPYLAEGDFHLYFEKGEPKIAMRFDDDVAIEFQGVSNDDRLIPEYFDVLEKYVQDNDIVLADKAKQEFELSAKNRDLARDIEDKIGDAVRTKDYEKILNYMKISTKKDENGKLILSHYEIPNGFDYKVIDINEDDLLKNVSAIEGNADFTRSRITGFGNIKYIGGNANFAGMTLEDLGKIEEIGGNADFRYAKINTMGNLQKIGKDLILDYADFKDLYSLRFVGGRIRQEYGTIPKTQLMSIKTN